MHLHQEQDQGRVRSEDGTIACFLIQSGAMSLNAPRLSKVNELSFATSSSAGRQNCRLLSKTELRRCLGWIDCQWCLMQSRPPPSDTLRILWGQQSATASSEQRRLRK